MLSNAARPQIGSAPLVGQPAPCSGDQQVLMTKRTKWTSGGYCPLDMSSIHRSANRQILVCSSG